MGYLFSITGLIACVSKLWVDYSERKIDVVIKKYKKYRVIKFWNCFYLLLSIICVAGILYHESYPGKGRLFNGDIVGLNFLLGYFWISRCNEIFFAFLTDAYDKLKPNASNSSSLLPYERIQLALKSYLELILDFALLYWILPVNFWISSSLCPREMVENIVNAPVSLVDFLYFSGVTITTLGYGDISPTHWWPKFLSVYEVLCGFILLVVSFTVYTGLNSESGEIS